MINPLSNLINRNRSAAKISQVLCSTINSKKNCDNIAHTGSGVILCLSGHSRAISAGLECSGRNGMVIIGHRSSERP